MSRHVNRLTARAVIGAKTPGLYPDGAGLYLQVTAGGAQSWLFRFMLNGRQRDMGLGPARVVSLAAARLAADECRKLLQDKIDPIEHRRQQRAQQRIEDAAAVTFRDCAERCIAAKKAGWKKAKQERLWTNTLTTYAFPIFGDLNVAQIDTALVLQAIEPIWATKHETASRVRSRIETILDWARVKGLRSGENPARWQGHLEQLLPAPTAIHKVKHRAALPFKEIGSFMARLRAMDGVSPRALEFQILTWVRPGEALGARWPEIDLEKRLWVIPADRMKGEKNTGEDHTVPLSEAALAVLRMMEPLRDRKRGDLVFPGMTPGKPMSENTPMSVLKRMGEAHRATAHGFRSTARDWGSECTDFPGEVQEKALAHAIENQVEAAYRRGELLEKRRLLMDAWAAHVAIIPAAVAA